MNAFLKHTSDFVLFVTVIKSGGISRGAAQLDLERTTVSRRLSNLEKFLGTPLLVRSSRSIELTNAGRRCYEYSQNVVKASEDAIAAARDSWSEPASTPVRIGAPILAVASVLQPLLDAFEAKSPDIKVELEIIDNWPKKHTAQPDVGIFFGERISDNASDQTRKIAAVEQVVVASPSYVGSRGECLSPQLLQHQRWISYPCSARTMTISTSRDDGEYVIDTMSSFPVQNMLIARQTAIAGLGVCLLPKLVCEHQLDRRDLIQLSPEYSYPKLPIYLVKRHEAMFNANVLELVLFLSETAQLHERARNATGKPDYHEVLHREWRGELDADLRNDEDSVS